MNNLIVASFNESSDFARRLAKRLSLKHLEIIHKRFPDGENYIRFPTDIKGKKVIFVDFMRNDEEILRLIFALKTGRELKANKNILVAPYMPYMRQDKMFNPGECVTNKAIADFLNPNINSLFTVDAHIHRIKSLSDIFTCKTNNIESLDIISDYIKKNFKDSVVVGPDAESEQWVKEICKITGLEGIVLIKKRFSSHKVEIAINEKEKQAIKGRNVIVFDDIISSGTTMFKIIKILKKNRVKKIDIICVHGIFAEGSYEKLMKEVDKVVSSNTIRHKSNKIDLIPSIAENIRKELF